MVSEDGRDDFISSGVKDGEDDPQKKKKTVGYTDLSKGTQNSVQSVGLAYLAKPLKQTIIPDLNE